MKKILILSVLVSLSFNNAYAEYGYDYNTMKVYEVDVSKTKEIPQSPNRPDWFEFCPPQYENPPGYDNNSYFNYMKRAVQQDGNYWRQRKDDFERFRSECDERDGQTREACYVRLRNREQSLSSRWSPAVEAEQRRRQQIWQDQADTYRPRYPVQPIEIHYR